MGKGVFKGCSIVAASFGEHFAKSGKAIVMLVEVIDVYLLGTVMLVFGMGIYELFVSNLDIAKSQPQSLHQNRSNLFGLFTLLVSLSSHIRVHLMITNLVMRYGVLFDVCSLKIW
ncbi:hypothetical protein RND81_04G022900 [Saponaria officinalis]|uniref:Uncharacterized protein n=1 Tax=Saponaria officinalis TaxID=3572 RepID=A0AAW1LFQ1_SAPOF